MRLGQRSFETILRRLEQLIMPDQYAAAREAYISELNLDDLNDVVVELQELDASLPEAVTALLELRIGRAYELIVADPAWRQRRIDVRSLLVAMSKIRVAYWLRTLAMECAAWIHRPFGWDPLDNADRPGIVRYGAVYNRVHLEKRRLQAVVQSFESRAQDIPWSEVIKQPPVGWMDCSADAGSDWETIAHRAVVQLHLWHRAHGDDLEAVVTSKMKVIANWLEDFSNKMAERAPTSKTWNVRVANLSGASTLVVFYHAARYAIAWTNEGGNNRKDRSPSGNGSGIDELIDWRMTSKLMADYPLPKLEKDRGVAVGRAFTLLRYAIVDDENMLSSPFQKATLADGSVLHIRSQADAEKAHGRRYTFDELWGALPGAASIPNEISRAANVRKVKSLADMDPPMALAMNRVLDDFMAGVTAS